MSERLREIAEAGTAAHDRMMELGRGVGALLPSERDALDDYDEAFGEHSPTVPAILDVVRAAEALARYFPSHGVAEVTVDAMPCVDLANALARLREVTA